jgi:hypothetical protein
MSEKGIRKHRRESRTDKKLDSRFRGNDKPFNYLSSPAELRAKISVVYIAFPLHAFTHNPQIFWLMPAAFTMAFIC